MPKEYPTGDASEARVVVAYRGLDLAATLTIMVGVFTWLLLLLNVAMALGEQYPVDRRFGPVEYIGGFLAGLLTIVVGGILQVLIGTYRKLDRGAAS